MKLDRVKPGFLEPEGIVRIVCKDDPVGSDLNLGESQFFCHADDSRKILPHCGLAAGELDCGSGNRSLGPEEFEHHDDLIERGLIDKPAGTSVCKTEFTVKVTAVGEIDIGKQSLGVVVITKSA